MSNFKIEYDDSRVRGALQRVIDLGRRPGPVLRDIAALGEAATRLRFRLQTGPDGEPWKPSLRAQITGGSTLVESGHLVGSVSSGHGSDYAEWGVNRIYAAIHQFGGTIRPKSAKALKFKIPGGGFAVVKAVQMPARPFLGVSKDDKRDILNMIRARLSGARRVR